MRRLVTFIIGIILTQFGLNAQTRLAIKPIDFQQHKVWAEAEGVDGFYTLHRLPELNERNLIVIRKWNGVFWKHVSSLVIRENDTICDMIFDASGRLYIAGGFEAIIAGDTLRNLAFLNNGAWSGITDFKAERKGSPFIRSMAVFQNRLVIGGDFDSLNQRKFGNLAFVDSSVLSAFSDQSLETGVRGSIYKLVARNEKLYAAGNFSVGSDISSLAYFQNGLWSEIPNNFKEVLQFTFSQGNNMMAFVKTSQDSLNLQLYDANLQEWDKIESGIESVYQIYSMVQYENSVFATGQFDDSLGNQPLSFLNFRNGRWNRVNFNIQAQRLAISKGTLFISGVYSPTLNYLHSAQYTIGEYRIGQRMVFGRMFVDLNSNCDLNQSDLVLKGVGIRFKDRNQVVFTNDSGRYYYYFTGNLSGNPEVVTKGFNFDFTTCIKDSNDLLLNGSIVGPIDIALQPKQITNSEISSSIALQRGHRLRQGERNTLRFTIQNIGLKPATNVFVQFRGAQRLKNFHSNPPLQVLNDSMIGWQLNTLNPMQQVNIHFSYAIQDISDIPNNVLDFRTQVSYFNGEDTQYLADSYSQSVSGTQEDLNVRKEQFLSHKMLDDNAIIHTSDTSIFYQISFRNSLNEVVNEVVIIDTLNLQHNYKYTQEITSSHPYSTQVVQDPNNQNIGYLIWTFSNLNLIPNPNNNPEIVSDAGFIKFKFVFNSLSHGEVVKNRALVIMNGATEEATNPVICLADQNVSIPQISNKEITLKAYPNPCHSELYIESEMDGSNTKFDIMDLQGRKVHSGILQDSKIDMSKLNSGVFIILFHTQNGVQSVRVMKL